MRLAIVGSRTFTNYKLLESIVDKKNPGMIISGGADGADSLANKYAKERGLPILIFYPNWNKFGKRAGYLRNEKIVSAAESVIAFWDGKSRGTKSSIDITKSQNKPIEIVNDGIF